MADSVMDKVVALAKRRGFIYPSSEIYGGMANTYDYGPMGAELLRNIRNYWWDYFVTRRPEIMGLETSIFMNPRVWEASGHTSNFNDALIDCKNCKYRTRADHLIEENVGDDVNVEGRADEELTKIIKDNGIKCPKCGVSDWTDVRQFNQLFETHVGILEESQSLTYLRGETAQGMFVDFKNILNSMSPKRPFGLAQSGKVFRNEITLGQNVFRTLEFDLAEFEFYIREEEWEKWFEYWKKEVHNFAVSLGIDPTNLRWRPHTSDELAHYSSRTEDLEYQFSFGFKEWYAVAYRTDFDLRNHMEKSGTDLRYHDPYTNERFIPHVIEPTFGMSRSVLVILNEAYTEEELEGGKIRVVLKLDPKIAPFEVAVFPLLKNNPDLVERAQKVFRELLNAGHRVAYDDRGNIGKRYYAQDEIGTPWCITIDYDTLEDDTVTVRDRDTTEQERVHVGQLKEYIGNRLTGNK